MSSSTLNVPSRNVQKIQSKTNASEFNTKVTTSDDVEEFARTIRKSQYQGSQESQNTAAVKKRAKGKKGKNGEDDGSKKRKLSPEQAFALSNHKRSLPRILIDDPTMETAIKNFNDPCFTNKDRARALPPFRGNSEQPFAKTIDLDELTGRNTSQALIVGHAKFTPAKYKLAGSALGRNNKDVKQMNATFLTRTTSSEPGGCSLHNSPTHLSVKL